MLYVSTPMMRKLKRVTCQQGTRRRDRAVLDATCSLVDLAKTRCRGDGDDAFIIALGADHGNSNNGETIYGGNGVDVIRFTSTTPNDTLNLRYWIDVEEVRMVADDGSENSTAGMGINADWLGVGPNIRLYGITDFAKASDIISFGATALVIASGSATSSGTAGITAISALLTC